MSIGQSLFLYFYPTMTRIIVIIILFIISNVSSVAQVVIVNDECKQAYEDILSLRFNDAKKIIETERILNKDNLFLDYLENYMDFLTITIGEDENQFRELEKNISERTDKIEELPDNSPYKNYFLGNINLQWATVNLRFKNYTTGAFQINRAYRMISRNNKQFPNFYPNKITLGVLHIMVGIVPDTYGWLLNLVSMHGTVQQGRFELMYALEKCMESREYGFLSSEVLFYMGMIDLNLSPDPEYAEYILNKITGRTQDNLLLVYLKVNILMKNGKNDMALDTFNEIDSSFTYLPFYYLNYLRGECHLRRLDTYSSSYNFSNYLENFTGTNYIKDTWLKLGWCSLLSGDTTGYFNCIDQIPVSGSKNLDADLLAHQVSDQRLIPNIDLLKSRLLFDGGYYGKADSLLKSIPDNGLSHIETIEKQYRSARVAHSDGRIDDAIVYYKSTIDLGLENPQYFAANSALKLGNIYEMAFDTSQSIHYYELCLDIEFDQYRNSIRGKAKQGLNRLTK